VHSKISWDLYLMCEVICYWFVAIFEDDMAVKMRRVEHISRKLDEMISADGV